jgi:acyl carrier protein
LAVLTGSLVLVQHSAFNMTEAPGSGGEKKTKLLEIISTEILEVGSGFNEDADLFEAGLDSMAIMQLLIRIESEFGVQLRVGQINRDNFSTVRKIDALIA